MVITFKLNDDVSLSISRLPYGFNFEIHSETTLTPAFSVMVSYQHQDKSALCVGGAIYGYYNDDVLAEAAIKIIEEQILEKPSSTVPV